MVDDLWYSSFPLAGRMSLWLRDSGGKCSILCSAFRYDVWTQASHLVSMCVYSLFCNKWNITLLLLREDTFDIWGAQILQGWAPYEYLHRGTSCCCFPLLKSSWGKWEKMISTNSFLGCPLLWLTYLPLFIVFQISSVKLMWFLIALLCIGFWIAAVKMTRNLLIQQCCLLKLWTATDKGYESMQTDLKIGRDHHDLVQGVSNLIAPHPPSDSRNYYWPQKGETEAWAHPSPTAQGGEGKAWAPLLVVGKGVKAEA